MNYFIFLILLPIITHAMDCESIKKYSLQEGNALISKTSLSNQEREKLFSCWFTVSLIEYLNLKQNKQENLMARELNTIVPEMEFLFFEKKVLKNPLSIRDGKNTYSIDLLKEAKNCGAMNCLAVFAKYEPNCIDDPSALLKQLFAMKEDAGKSNLVLDGFLRNESRTLSGIQLFFATIEKIPYPREAYHPVEGYDSIG